MRAEYLLAAAAACFLAYAYFHEASEVEYLWDRFMQFLAVGAIGK